MKKFFILLTATLISVGMHATPVTWGNTFCNAVQAYKNMSGDFIHADNSADGITVTYAATDAGEGASPSGLNGGNINLSGMGAKLTFTTTDNLKKIVIYICSSMGAPKNDRLSAGWAYDGTAQTLTWVGDQTTAVDLFYTTGIMGITVDHIVFMNLADYEEEQSLLPTVVWDNAICSAVEAHTDLASHTYVHQNNTRCGITLTYVAEEIEADLGWGYNKGDVVLNQSNPLTFTTTINAFETIVMNVDDSQPISMHKLSAGWTWNETAHQLSWSGVATTSVALSAAEQTYFSVQSIIFTKSDPAAGLVIYDTDENIESVLATKLNTHVDLTIHRTLYKDNAFNTLCLPFSLDANAVNTYFDGCELYAFESAAMNGGSLDLFIAEASTIEAGQPYLIKWASGTDITEQTYANVEIEVSEGQVIGDGVKFVGTIGRTQLENGNQNHLFVGANNSLYYPNTDNKLKAFRAYFLVEGVAAPHGAPARLVIRKTPTDLEKVQGDNVQSTKVLRDGILFIERNGRFYNAQGQVVK